jgi:predicted HicB family RNase H-like nuclease
MNTMNHNGYIAGIEFDEEDRIFTGRLLGIDDIVTFHGESVAELETALHEAVAHYLDVCIKTGREPQKPYSGRFALRMPPELHAQTAAKAASVGKSIKMTDVTQSILRTVRSCRNVYSTVSRVLAKCKI